MGNNLFRKIILSHLVEGEPILGKEISIRIDQVLTQDATGTLVYLELEAMGIDRIVPLAVSYVDHNTLGVGPENADDHLFLKSSAAKFGAYFSPPGTGICHQLHLECFGAPGKTLLGSDSHTPTGGGLGMVAIGAGGLDVALAMAGEPFTFKMPEVIEVRLLGKLPPWVSGKDVILELLRRLSVKGGVGKVFEYTGPGVRELSVFERATICNMGTELGATTSLFPSDTRTQAFLWAQGRPKDFVPLGPDEDASYEGCITINLSELEPLVALPSSPDKVRPVREVEGIKVDQVILGSCTNSSFYDLAILAELIDREGKHPDVELVVAPGSRQVLELLREGGYLEKLIRNGVRILEPACGPCIGMGLAPPSGGVSLRTFNRNFEGRSGTKDAQVYLSGPEVAVATAIRGRITDPRSLGPKPELKMPPPKFKSSNLIIPPPKDREKITIRRGPNIKPLKTFEPLSPSLEVEVLIVLGDNISTDHILPAGPYILPLRSNISALSQYVFHHLDPQFPERAKRSGNGIIVGGENYGQGSSREHAALCPRWLGVRAVLAKSFARIHRSNLINFGIVPLIFAEPKDYEKLRVGQKGRLLLGDLEREVYLEIPEEGLKIRLLAELSPREREILKAGGILNFVKGR